MRSGPEVEERAPSVNMRRADGMAMTGKLLDNFDQEVVEKVRVQKRHLKPGRKGMRSGGIVEQEGYVDASNVMLVDPASHTASRVRI